MNKNLSLTVGILIILYIMFSVVAFGFGSLGYSRDKWNNKCLEPTRRFEILFPTYRLGCWLTAPADSN